MAAQQQSLLNVQSNLANVIKNIESNLFTTIQRLENNVIDKIESSSSNKKSISELEIEQALTNSALFNRGSKFNKDGITLIYEWAPINGLTKTLWNSWFIESNSYLNAQFASTDNKLRVSWLTSFSDSGKHQGGPIYEIIYLPYLNDIINYYKKIQDVVDARNNYLLTQSDEIKLLWESPQLISVTVYSDINDNLIKLQTDYTLGITWDSLTKSVYNLNTPIIYKMWQKDDNPILLERNTTYFLDKIPSHVTAIDGTKLDLTDFVLPNTNNPVILYARWMLPSPRTEEQLVSMHKFSEYVNTLDRITFDQQITDSSLVRKWTFEDRADTHQIFATLFDFPALFPEYERIDPSDWDYSERIVVSRDSEAYVAWDNDEGSFPNVDQMTPEGKINYINFISNFFGLDEDAVVAFNSMLTSVSARQGKTHAQLFIEVEPVS